MTKTETAELHELGRTPEEIAERGAKVIAMLNDEIRVAPELHEALDSKLDKPVRKPRSDKGKPKPPKPAPQAPGALTTAQVLEITRLHAAEMLAQEIYTQAKLELVILADKAELAHRQAVAYLETLAGK